MGILSAMGASRVGGFFGGRVGGAFSMFLSNTWRSLSNSRISKITYSQNLSAESAVWVQKLVTKLLINELGFTTGLGLPVGA